MPPDIGLINAIAADLGVHPSFIEKDWHAMRIAGVLAPVGYGTARLVFAGGTCLSKAYGLIRRFSEDLDFRVVTDGATLSRPERRQYREKILEALRQRDRGWTLDENSIVIGNESQYFTCACTTKGKRREQRRCARM